MGSTSWLNCKNILFIRPDNMGDVLMMTPALRAVKQTFNCRITLLTSRMGSVITPYIPEIDETLMYDLPWVKTNEPISAGDCVHLIEKLKSLQFDGAIISTVYSQNPLPAAMIAFLSGIPLRLAFCRENPYGLLTHWVADKEPYSFVQHQVERDLNLVASIGAHIDDDSLSIRYTKSLNYDLIKKLNRAGVDINKPWYIIHPGVSEVKREYPPALWIDTGKQMYEDTRIQILITGAANEKPLADKIREGVGEGAYAVAGLFNIEEFITLIANAQLAVTVNTSTVHIAAATHTPLIVLYALTNPQHTPWKVTSVVLPFSVPDDLQSKNEVIQYVHKKYYKKAISYPSPGTIVTSAQKLLSEHPEKSLLQA